MSFTVVAAIIVGVLSFQQLAVASPAMTSPPCQDLFFTVPVQASNESGILLPSAVYQISAAYCPPTVSVAGRSRVVQLLIHGGTADKYYWSALGPVGSGYQEDYYSWVDFARSQGYHTIAIDNLGVGNSSRPDPTVVRLPVEANITSQIVHQLRSHPLPLSLPPSMSWFQYPESFDRVVLISHSVASLQINYLMTIEPQVADAVMLTGYVHAFSHVNTSVQQFAPGATVFPQRFAGLDPGYTTIVSAENMRQSFFGNNGSFDPIIPVINWQREDVQAIGEQESIGALLTSSFFSAVATEFTAPLALIAGAQDEPLCGGDCGEGPDNLAAMSKSFFPNARPFNPIIIPNTGHFLNLHLSAPETFARAHAWLAEVGL